MGEANDVTSQRAPKENFGAGDIKEDVVRPPFRVIFHPEDVVPR